MNEYLEKQLLKEVFEELAFVFFDKDDATLKTTTENIVAGISRIIVKK